MVSSMIMMAVVWRHLWNSNLIEVYSITIIGVGIMVLEVGLQIRLTMAMILPLLLPLPVVLETIMAHLAQRSLSGWAV